jgi:tetratricopeptide (TPR) repeat protein
MADARQEANEEEGEQVARARGATGWLYASGLLVLASSLGACRAAGSAAVDSGVATSACTSTSTPLNELSESGVARVKERKFEEAERCFLLAKQLQPSVQMWTNLGSLYLDWSHALQADGHTDESKRRLHQSVDAFEASLAMSAGGAPAVVHVLLAGNYDELGERAKAIPHLAELLRRRDVTPADRKKAHEMLDVFVRDPSPSLSPEDASRQETDFRTGSSLVSPFMILADKPGKPLVRADLEKGRKLLEGVVARDPRNWAAHWFIGKAGQGLGDRTAANEAFRRAGEIHPYHPDIAREETEALLFLGGGADAVVVARRGVEFNPEDAGLVANLAVAQLIAGDVAGAERSAATALDTSPNDTVTKDLVAFIADVRAGKRPRPQKLPIKGLQ